MDYVEFSVPGALASRIECIWRLRDPDPGQRPQTIYPDGRCELLVHLGTPMARHDPQHGWQSQAPVLFAGQLTGAIKLAGRGPIDCIGFRLKPAASAVAGIRPSEGRDQVLDLMPMAPTLARALQTSAETLAADSSSERWVKPLLNSLTLAPIDPAVARGIELLEAQEGRQRIAELAASVDLNLRQFQARFKAAVGMTPKQFAKVIRLQTMLKSLDSGTNSIADTALSAGFADQAHATRDLARVTGLTPGRLLRALQADPDSEEAIALAAAFIRGHSASGPGATK